MTLRRLKWLTILAPLFFLAALELLRAFVQPSLFHAWPGYLLLAGLVVLGTLFFSEAIFSVIERLQRQLQRQNEELLALHGAGLAVVGELDLDAVLQRVVDRARDLAGARYGAVTYLSGEGERPVLLTSGISPEQRAAIGPDPVGHGLLGLVLQEGQRLRLPDLTQHPLSVGFPPNHPPMKSLLAVPIRSAGQVLGDLYVTEKADASEFDQEDEDALARFATVAAMAIENAVLHHQVQVLAVTQERERIAREMHDSLAQVLGYVNTKAQAAQAFLDRGEDARASAQIGQLAEAARAAYADVREDILALRTSLGDPEGFLGPLRQYLERWQDQSGVRARLIEPPVDEPLPAIDAIAEVQLLRIIQESLANVRKHARATQVEVRLGTAGETLAAVIHDDGAGFDPARLGRSDFPRFGLATMRERAEGVGGALVVDSLPGEGTTVTVHIPAAGTSTRGGVTLARSHR